MLLLSYYGRTKRALLSAVVSTQDVTNALRNNCAHLAAILFVAHGVCLIRWTARWKKIVIWFANLFISWWTIIENIAVIYEREDNSKKLGKCVFASYRHLPSNMSLSLLLLNLLQLTAYILKLVRVKLSWLTNTLSKKDTVYIYRIATSQRLCN